MTKSSEGIMSNETFYQRLDRIEQENRIKRIFADRPDNLHDYQGCANDLAWQNSAESLPAEPEPVMFPIDRECVKCAHQFKGTWTTLCPNCEAEPKPTPSTSAELLPCPFCGSMDLKIVGVISEDDPKREYARTVMCRVCHARGRHSYPIGWAESHLAAMEAWNEREPQPASISSEQTHALETAVKLINVFITNPSFREAWKSEIEEVEAAWAAAKGSTETEGR